jgi:hypothetical protein
MTLEARELPNVLRAQLGPHSKEYPTRDTNGAQVEKPPLQPYFSSIRLLCQSSSCRSTGCPWQCCSSACGTSILPVSQSELELR